MKSLDSVGHVHVDKKKCSENHNGSTAGILELLLRKVPKS